MRSRILLFFFAFSVFGHSPLLAAPLHKTALKNLKPTLQTTPHLLKKNPTVRAIQKGGSVLLQAHIVHIFRGTKPDAPSPHIKHLPLMLLHNYGFNRYRSVKKLKQVVAYKQHFVFALNQNYRFRLKPLGYKASERRIRMQTTLLRKSAPGQFNISVQTVLRLRHGRTMAFIGPVHKKGRLLLLLSAHHIP